jgi:hypothetical protein
MPAIRTLRQFQPQAEHANQRRRAAGKQLPVPAETCLQGFGHRHRSRFHGNDQVLIVSDFGILIRLYTNDGVRKDATGHLQHAGQNGIDALLGGKGQNSGGNRDR